MKRSKATQADMRLRTLEIVGMLRKGYTRGMILQYAANSWGKRSRTADTLISLARKVIDKEFEKDLPHQAKEIAASFDQIYERAMYEGTEKRLGKDGPVIYVADLHAAIAARMAKAKILGLLKDVVRYEGTVDGKEEYGDADLTNQAA